MCKIILDCKRKVPFVRQPNRFSCVYAATKMVMLSHNDKFNAPEINRGITNKNDLLAFLQLTGIVEVHEHPNARRMIHTFNMLFEKYGPIIADIKLSMNPGLGSEAESWTHWIVIIGITDNDKIAYLDPAKDAQLQYMSFYDFEELLVALYAKG